MVRNAVLAWPTLALHLCPPSTPLALSIPHHALYAGVLADLFDDRGRLKSKLARGHQDQYLPYRKGVVASEKCSIKKKGRRP